MSAVPFATMTPGSPFAGVAIEEGGAMRILRVLAAVVFAFAGISVGGGAHAATIAEVSLERGGTALALFVSESGCFQRETLVIANDQKFKQGAGPFTAEQGGTLIVVENDTCLGTQRIEIGNFDTLDLKFNNVQSATLSGTATVTDIADPAAPQRTYAVALKFASTGAAESGTGHFNFHFPGGQLVYHSQGAFTAATATGSVAATSPTPTGNVIAGLTGTGTLDQHHAGQVQIIRT